MQGSVAVSHAYALSMVEKATLARIAAALAGASVAIMTGRGRSASAHLPRLVAEAITILAGPPTSATPGCPYDDGDTPERARMVDYRTALLTDAELRLTLSLVTETSARVRGLPVPLIEEGAPTDLVVVHAVQFRKPPPSPPRRARSRA